MVEQPHDQKNSFVSMSSQEQDDYLFHLLITSLLYVEKLVDIHELLGHEQDSSRKDSVEGERKPEVSSQDINKVNSNEEAPTDSTHAWIGTSELPDPQISIDDINYALGLLDGSEPIEGATNIREDNQTQDNLAHVALMDNNPFQRADDELARIRRCVGRSCQDYASEMTSLQRNNNASTSNISSCTTKSDKRNAFNEKPVLPRKHTSDPQRCILQGNGSCLNHYNGKENDNMSSERKTESQSSSSLHLSARQGHCLSLVPSQMERQLGPSENEVQATKYFGRSTPKRTMKVEFKNITNQQLNQNMRRTTIALGKCPIDPCSSGSNHEKEEENEDLCQSIPQRKRHKSNLTKKVGSCRSCRCKKSKCKKLYCECFAAKVYCTGCACKDCENKPKDTALQACTDIDPCKPPAFVPAVRNFDSSPQIDLRK